MEAWENAAVLIGASQNPAALTDTEGRVLGARAPAGETWLSPGTSLLDAVRVADRSLISTAFQEVVERGIAQTVDIPFAREGGGTTWFQAALSPVRMEGEIVGVFGLFTDVTDHRREEERLKRAESLMVDTQGVAHLGTWDWNLSEPHAKWSAELFRIYGLDPAGHVPSYEDYLTRIHPDDRQRVIAATNAVLHNAKPYSHDERVYRPDGSLRWLHTWAEPVVEDGKVVRLIGVCQDITDRKLAELEVGARLQEKEILLQEIHHRVKNNLQVIVSLLQMQAGTVDDARIAAVLAEAGGRVRSMALVHEAFDESANLGRIDFSEFVERVSREIAQSHGAEERNIRVDLHAEPLNIGMGQAVDCGLIVNELISNAFKHAFPAGRHGVIRIEIGSRPDGGASLLVADDGIGMPSEEIEGSLHTLGIRLVRALARQLGATLKIDVHQGTRVLVELPATAVARPAK